MSYNLKTGKEREKERNYYYYYYYYYYYLTLLEVEDDPFSPSLTLILANNILIFSSTSIIILSVKIIHTLFRVVQNYCCTFKFCWYAVQKRNLVILKAKEKEKIFKTRKAMTIKLGVHAFHINLYYDNFDFRVAEFPLSRLPFFR